MAKHSKRYNEVARDLDPRAVYDSFYEERDFKKRAGQVKAATLYTEGFEDANVKAAMIPGWFNAIQAPKLGLFGHWLHQHPARLDCEALFVGWMEHYVKGIKYNQNYSNFYYYTMYEE